MNDDFKKLYDRRQKREERRYIYKPVIITLVVIMVFIGLVVLATHYDSAHDTTKAEDMLLVVLVLVVGTVMCLIHNSH